MWNILPLTMFLSFLAKSKQGDIVYLPCYSHTWDKQGTGFLNERLLAISTKTQWIMQKIICSPVHNHWGQVCFATATNTVYFDNGLKLLPPTLLTVVRNMLSGSEIMSSQSTFKLQKWNNGNLSLPLPRIHMPKQTAVGVGAGSSGFALILSFRDIIRSGFAVLWFGLWRMNSSLCNQEGTDEHETDGRSV